MPLLPSIELPKILLALSICLLAFPINYSWHHFYVHTWLPGNLTQKSLQRYMDSLPQNKEGIQSLLQLRTDRQDHLFVMQFELFRILYSLRCSIYPVCYFAYMVFAPFMLLMLAFTP